MKRDIVSANTLVYLLDGIQTGKLTNDPSRYCIIDYLRRKQGGKKISYSQAGRYRQAIKNTIKNKPELNALQETESKEVNE